MRPSKQFSLSSLGRDRLLVVQSRIYVFTLDVVVFAPATLCRASCMLLLDQELLDPLPA